MTKTKKEDSKKQGEFFPALNLWGMDRVFDDFKKDFERTLSSFPKFDFPASSKFLTPSCDLVDEGNRYEVEVDLPGVNKKEINLNITDNSLEISAEHKEESEKKSKNYLKKERSEVSYYRTLSLPEKVLSDQVKAKLADGTLKITLPKEKPTAKSKKQSISIQ